MCHNPPDGNQQPELTPVTEYHFLRDKSVTLPEFWRIHMVHWALNAVAMRHFVHCRKMLDSNPVSQLYTLPDLSDVIFYLLCYKGAITFCRMVILSICSISGLADCLERSYFVSKYHIFNILLEVPNLSSSCKKLMPASNFLWVLPLNLPHSPIFEKTPTFIAEETARLSLFFSFFLC